MPQARLGTHARRQSRNRHPRGNRNDDSAPALSEERYNLEDALVVAAFFNCFIRHADVVKIANIAQIVNVIAPIQTCGDDLLVQSIFHVFEQYSARRTGTSLEARAEGPTYVSPSYGRVDVVDVSAIVDGNTLHVFAVNRSLESPAPVRITVADRTITAVGPSHVISGNDPKAENTYPDQNVVAAKPFDAMGAIDGSAHGTLPPLSVATMTFELS